MSFDTLSVQVVLTWPLGNAGCSCANAPSLPLFASLYATTSSSDSMLVPEHSARYDLMSLYASTLTTVNSDSSGAPYCLNMLGMLRLRCRGRTNPSYHLQVSFPLRKGSPSE